MCIRDRYNTDLPKRADLPTTGKLLRSTALAALIAGGLLVTTVLPAEYGIDPTSYAEMRDGCYDIGARIADMNANGVLGSMCFPSFPQFCGQLFSRTEDKDVALAMVRAYNDWHIDEWCGHEPGRFIPLAPPAIFDDEGRPGIALHIGQRFCEDLCLGERGLIGFVSAHAGAAAMRLLPFGQVSGQNSPQAESAAGPSRRIARPLL